MLKIKTGDKVKVLIGRDKGREGEVVRVFPKKGTALVEGINMYKKHVKKQVSRDGNGGIYDVSRPVALSKLALVTNGKKLARVGFKIEGNKKVRIDKKTGKIIDKIK